MINEKEQKIKEKDKTILEKEIQIQKIQLNAIEQESAIGEQKKKNQDLQTQLQRCLQKIAEQDKAAEKHIKEMLDQRAAIKMSEDHTFKKCSSVVFPDEFIKSVTNNFSSKLKIGEGLGEDDGIGFGGAGV